MTDQAEAVMYVWRRDTESDSMKWVWWVVGPLLALTGFGAFAAYMAERPEEVPTFLGLGLIGAVLVWSIPRVYRFGRRRNPDITMDGREMVWAKVRVPIDQVESWSVVRSTTHMSNGTTISRMTIGVVNFEMMNGEKTKRFHFPHLSEAEVLELRSAIEPVLPGREILSD